MMLMTGIQLIQTNQKDSSVLKKDIIRAQLMILFQLRGYQKKQKRN